MAPPEVSPALQLGSAVRRAVKPGVFTAVDSQKSGLLRDVEALVWRVACVLPSPSTAEGLSLPDVAHLGPVLKEPAVGHLVLPAHIPGVLPQQPDLVAGVPSVPQGVAEMFPWASFRFHSLDKDTSEVSGQDLKVLPVSGV